MGNMPSISATSGSQVVVSRSSRSRWILFVVIGAGVLVLLLGAGLVWHWQPWHAKTTLKTTTSQQNSGTTKPAPTPAQQIAAAQQQLQKAQTPAQKSDAYLQLGNAFVADGQTSQAIGSYQNALNNLSSTETEKQTAILFAEATAYYYSGDTSKQIAALQQAITLLQGSTDPYAQSKIDYAKMTINALQGGGR